jgi:hypothetical protein
MQKDLTLKIGDVSIAIEGDTQKAASEIGKPIVVLSDLERQISGSGCTEGSPSSPARKRSLSAPDLDALPSTE